MHILVISRLGQQKIRDKLMPLVLAEHITHVTLVRHAPVDIDSPKLTQVIHNVGLDPQGLKRGIWMSLHNIWACLINGWRVARRENPDLILAYNFTPYGLIALLVGQLAGCKTGVSLIGTDYNRRVRHPLLRRPLSWLLRRFSLVMIFGDEQRHELFEMGLQTNRVFVLPNTTDTSRYQPCDDPSQVIFDLIYTGYLRPDKRVDLLLYTLHQIQGVRPGTNLNIVGIGTELDNLKTLTDKLGLSNVVHFNGWANDVRPYLQQARILCLFSEHEGLPMSVIEALCSGLPVIVTDVGALSTIIRHNENGFLLPSPADPAQAASIILSVLDNPARYAAMQAEALTTCSQHDYAQAAQVWDMALHTLSGR